MARICAATFSARPWSRWAASAWITLATPATWDAALAASAAPLPATSTCTSPPIAAAALTVLRVAPLRALLSCSAMTRVVMGVFLEWHFRHSRAGGNPRGAAMLDSRLRGNDWCGLDDLGDVLELVDQGGHVGHLDAGAALG